MGETEIIAFLSHLAAGPDVAASTQNQALSALLFLDKVVLERPVERFSDRLTPARLPVVRTREVRSPMDVL